MFTRRVHVQVQYRPGGRDEVKVVKNSPRARARQTNVNDLYHILHLFLSLGGASYVVRWIQTTWPGWWWRRRRCSSTRQAPETRPCSSWRRCSLQTANPKRKCVFQLKHTTVSRMYKQYSMSMLTSVIMLHYIGSPQNLLTPGTNNAAVWT